ncbi:MAG: zf-HC2 domain-containing protein, partial [Planctomycetes bacterium]|nr:zf-HC2 domain-containing protein [Planctomycetota bacterium]
MDSCQDIQKHLNQYLDNALEAEAQQAVKDHLAQCADCRSYFESEAVLEKKLTGIIKEPGTDDQAIWARGVNAIREAEFKQSVARLDSSSSRPESFQGEARPEGAAARRVGARQTWTVFKYLVPLAAAAMILLAILPLFIFSPPAIPEIVRTAVQEHRSFLSDQARMDIADVSVDQMREYFIRQQNFAFGDCCCSLLKKKEVELKGA